MDAKEPGRRRFLKEGAALAGLALGAGPIRSASGQTAGSEAPPEDPRAYGVRSRFENSARGPLEPGYGPGGTPLQDSMGIITPSGLHFQIGGFPSPSPPPDIDPRQYRLLIHGLVDRPLILTLAELKRLPSVSRIHFIECAGNTDPSIDPSRPLARQTRETVQETHGSTACSEWTGVLLSLLLKEAGVQRGASWIVADGADPNKRAKSMPLEKARDDVIVAYGQNGEAIRPEQGYPLRLVTPGWEGVHNIKWLRQIKVVGQPYMTRDDAVKYSILRPDGTARWFMFEMGPNSVITFPSGKQQLSSRGFYEIRGLAWSGGGVVRRVEVSTDGGRTWKDAQLQEPVLRIAHTRFRFPWNWDGEEAVLQSRCTDERGAVQPSLAEMGRIWGANPEYWKSHQALHFNPIQPWKVTREGSVSNAMFL